MGCAMADEKVLVVDDESISREVVSLALELGGIEVVTARDAETGLQIVLRDEPDVVVTDIHMPRLSGIQFAARINDELANRAPPVIGISSSREVIARLRSDPLFAEVMTKPVPPGTLVAAVRRHLDSTSSSIVGTRTVNRAPPCSPSERETEPPTTESASRVIANPSPDPSSITLPRK